MDELGFWPSARSTLVVVGLLILLIGSAVWHYFVG